MPEDNVINTIKKVKDKVKYILQNSEKSRDNDVYLYLTYLYKFHNLGDEIGRDNVRKLFKVMNNSPFPESIRRSRQKIQEDGEYLGTRRLKRMQEEVNVRKEIKNV